MPRHTTMTAADEASGVMSVFMAVSIWPVNAVSQLLR
jgi:hypothetical protein